MRFAPIVALVACYSPAAPIAVVCGANGACPSGQLCDVTTNRCVVPGTASDAAIDAPTIDAPTADAMIDAPLTVVGCADGEREAFANVATYPDIAGCRASWAGMPSLRAPRTNVACGDDIAGACGAPADACAVGWQMCGTTGAVADLTGVSPEECASASTSGRFLAAMSHCTDNVQVCAYGATLPCFDAGWCSEPVCCGAGCSTEAGCGSGVFPSATLTSEVMGAGCGVLPHEADFGVLCCKL